MIENSVFPDLLKQADIKPLYKKDSGIEKENDCKHLNEFI